MTHEQRRSQSVDMTEQCLAVHYAVSRVLAQAATCDAAIVPLLQALGTGFHWSLTALWLCESPAQPLSLRACWPAITDLPVSRDMAMTALPERILSSGEPAWDIDITSDATLSLLAKAARADARCAIAFPIRDHAMMRGVIVGCHRRTGTYDGHLARTFALLGHYIGQFFAAMPVVQAPQRDDLGHPFVTMPATSASSGERGMIASEQRKVERQTRDTLRALLEMAKALVQVSETDATDDMPGSPTMPLAKARRIATHLAEAIAHMFACCHVSIKTVDPDTELLAPLAVAGLSPEQEQEWWQKHALMVPLSRGGTDDEVRRFRDGEVVLLDMTRTLYRDLPNVLGASSMLVVALKIGDRIVGVLTLDNGAEPCHFTPEEIELISAVAKIAALVLERERLLREREEARANELALSEANRRMDEFLSIASHELKTPLTSIKGYIQLATHRLKRTLTPKPNGADLAQVIHTLQSAIDLLTRSDYYSDVLNHLVTALLDVSRIQANTISVRRVPCDLVDIVTTAVKAQRLAWPERDISLTVDDDLATVTADGERIGQVIANLLTNALTYSAADRPVAVVMHRDDDHIMVSVRDEGPGLSPEEQQHIWERFYSGAGQHHYAGGGLGIGLFISRTIIAHHDGQIGVRSDVGEGATFWFTLPTLHAS